MSESPVSHSRKRHDRGQLILITALGLAILLVALSLIVNTAIYTENLATRGEDTGGSKVSMFHSSVVKGTTGIVEYVNFHNEHSHDTLQRNLSVAMTDWSETSGFLNVVSGAATSVEIEATTNGTRIEQDQNSRNFTNASGVSDDWTVVSAVTQIRKFRMNVTDDNLEPSGATEFRVIADNGTHSWRMNVTESGGNIEVGVENRFDDEGTCQVSADFVWINITDGTFDGKACEALGRGPQLGGDYSIRYENPDNVSGSYTMIVDNESLATGPDPHLHDDSVGSSPYVSPAIYSVQLDLQYSTPRLTVNTTRRIAPGEA